MARRDTKREVEGEPSVPVACAKPRITPPAVVNVEEEDDRGVGLTALLAADDSREEAFPDAQDDDARYGATLIDPPSQIANLENGLQRPERSERPEPEGLLLPATRDETGWHVRLPSDLTQTLMGLSQLPLQIQQYQQQQQQQLQLQNQQLATLSARLDQQFGQVQRSAEKANDTAQRALDTAMKALEEARKTPAPTANSSFTGPAQGKGQENSIVVVGSWAENSDDTDIVADLSALLASLQLSGPRVYAPYKRGTVGHIKVDSHAQGEQIIKAIRDSGKHFSTKQAWASWRASPEIRAHRAKAYECSRAITSAYLEKHPNANAPNLTVCTNSGKVWWKKEMLVEAPSAFSGRARRSRRWT
eukprot:6476655-Amphidinium_carterae.1